MIGYMKYYINFYYAKPIVFMKPDCWNSTSLSVNKAV